MVREPRAGRTKTRLAKTIGVAEALRFYRATSRAVIARLSGLPFWETILAVAPDNAAASHVWPKRLQRIAQGQGDIGERMQRPMRNFPPGPVCVIGTDIPAIDAAHIRRAFRTLGNHSMAFGPAADGGFWLVGARRRPRVLEPYANVRWSSVDTLADVRRNLRGEPVGCTAELPDVDEIEDLVRERANFGRFIRPFA